MIVDGCFVVDVVVVQFEVVANYKKSREDI